ncbi:MAG: ATP-grasp domain-containing protein [Gammaproteobacteria bacterium]|nr:ATP-grasp domain-containing protein [Gammaproteobacteria bacterium]
MIQHVIFVAPFFMAATLRFLEGAANLSGVRLSLISQDPVDKLPAMLRQRIAGHWRVDNGLDPEQIVDAARRLAQELGEVMRMFGPLEQLQVPLAVARERLGIPGLSVESALNFRDKSRMKKVLENAGVPCARHALVGASDAAREFVSAVGFPVVVKPPAGAGGKSTFRLDRVSDFNEFLQRFPPDPCQPTLYEEFVFGTEYSFDSVMIAGQPIWYSISRYMPSPLEVMENTWIQWCVMLPRDVSGPEFTPIVDPAVAGIKALGLKTGLSHMEWFRLPDGRIAVSEVGARPPGAQFTSLLSYAHDINFYNAWPHLMVFDEFDPPPRRYAVGAAYIRGQGAGRVRRIKGLDVAQRRFGPIVVEAKLPREGQSPADSYEGDGYVIVRHQDTDVVEHALKDIVQTIRVELG